MHYVKMQKVWSKTTFHLLNEACKLLAYSTRSQKLAKLERCKFTIRRASIHVEVGLPAILHVLDAAILHVLDAWNAE